MAPGSLEVRIALRDQEGNFQGVSGPFARLPVVPCPVAKELRMVPEMAREVAELIAVSRPEEGEPQRRWRN